MRIVLGLGNPGPDYARTRHNVGMRAVTAFASKLRARFRSDGGQAEIARGRAAGEEILVVRPLTWMNLSGLAAGRLASRHGVDPGEFLVVYDDVALELGRLRLRERGTSGGHRGMESIIERLGTEDIPRLRMGILGESPTGDLADYVLDDFEATEETAVEEMIDRAAESLSLAIRRGFQLAANEINRKEKAIQQEPEKNTGSTGKSGKSD